MNNKFKTGSGCYTCKSCCKKTRATGNNEEDFKLCRICLENSYTENFHSDQNHKEDIEDCKLCKDGGHFYIRGDSTVNNIKFKKRR